MKILELDLTGTLIENRIMDEFHTLTKIEGKKDRIICPVYGTFYAESLSVRESTGKVLNEGVDYLLAYHEADYSEITGKDLESLIVIINPTVSNVVKISYQALGGKLEIVRESLEAAIDGINANALGVDYEDILNTPEGFVGDPSHPHKYWQLYGFESLIENLELLGLALQEGRKGSVNAIEEYMGVYKVVLDDIYEDYSRYIPHLTDINNPHNVTKNQLGLNNINNWPMANMQQSKDRTNDNLYMGIHGVSSLYSEHLLERLNLHLEDYNNPHKVKAEDLNLYTKEEIEDLYALRLLRTQTAYDSTLFEGKNINTFTTAVRTNLAASNVLKTSTFNPNRLVSNMNTGNNSSTFITVGDNTIREIEELTRAIGRDDVFRTWQYLPGASNGDAATWNAIVAANVPTDTIIFKNGYWNDSRSPDAGYFVVVGRRNADGTTTRIF